MRLSGKRNQRRARRTSPVGHQHDGFVQQREGEGIVVVAEVAECGGDAESVEDVRGAAEANQNDEQRGRSARGKRPFQL